MKRERRKIKLINPGLQLRFVGVFAGLSALSFALQGLFLFSRLSDQAVTGASAGASSSGIWIEMLLLSLGLFLPLTIAVGILMTHRLVGPAYRMEQHLRAILRGEEPGDCALRKGDELEELCDLLNKTVLYLKIENDGLTDQDADQKRKRFRAVS